MRRASRNLWKFVNRLVRRPAKRRPATRSFRPVLEAFEDRLLPSTLGGLNLGVVGGQVFVDSNSNGRRDAGETAVPGVQISLTGTTTANQPVSLSATTDANGSYTFFQVQPGTYQLSRGDVAKVLLGLGHAGNLGGTPSGPTVSTITVGQGQVGLNYNFPVLGLAPQGISLRFFATNFTGSPLDSFTAGSGQAFADGLAQPATPAAAGTASLSGFVYNAALATPGNFAAAGLGGVTVTLSGVDDSGAALLHTATTGSDGSYGFSGLRAGSYTLSVPQAPAGFRAGSAAAGSLGGIAPLNNQITGIQLTAGAAGATYVFGELPVSAPSGTALSLAASLADDTGASASDGITSDPSVQGTVQASSAVTSFTATLDNGTRPFDLRAQMGLGGVFLLNPGLMGQIAGGTLADGAHTLHLRVADSQGHAGTADVAFTLLRTPPAPTPTFGFAQGLPDLAPGVHVVKSSAGGTYTITGTAAAGLAVELAGTGSNLSTTADASGHFSFSVPLPNGATTLTVLSLDKAANISSQTAQFVVDAGPTASTIRDQALSVGQSAKTLDLTAFFTPSSATNTTVQFNTIAGPIRVELFDAAAPKTVANFLTYANAAPGRGYTNSIFDRLVNNFVLQGGSFHYDPNNHTLTPIQTGATVPGERSLPGAKSNVLGTIALALPGSPPNQNGGTSAYYFNLANNTNLDTDFTVFGKVADPQSMRVINALSAYPIQAKSSFNAALATLPLKDYSGTNFPADTTVNNFAFINNISTTQAGQKESLTFTATSANPKVATVSVTGGQLSITPVASLPASTTVTVTATDASGLSVSKTFTVNIS